MRAIGAAFVCAVLLYAVDNLYNGGAYTAALDRLLLDIKSHF